MRTTATMDAGSGRRTRRGRGATTRAEAKDEDEDARCVAVTRRRALARALGAVIVVGARGGERARAEGETREVVVEAVANERWIAVPAKFRVPSSWSNRPGQRAKREKYVMYTDTYGPNYRYTTSLPKFLNDGAAAAESVQLVVQSKEGLESIEDLGPQTKIDPARAFGIEIDGLVAADVKKSNVRSAKGGQTYYEWELDNGAKSFLLSACVSGGGLYAFVVEVDSTQFEASTGAYTAVLESLDIPRVEESRNDMSSRIYENR
ncbi:hypothetical protein BE221DRAFT_67402 [Ostreococcus tauri]|uniref:PsbP C-terminal domain-containing protein n=1 Tax=Ostreococcus tauri TaxID=70448 RepID=A0A1Y5IGP0_OSTTA|nr:hypothetical protein BE221DRAFT_67402 [Ostreococcus tauri]